METVSIYDAKVRLAQLVDRAASGQNVMVSRNGKPLVRITRLQAPKRRIKFGVLKGRLIEGAEEVYGSAASIWEVAIKAGLGAIEADPQALAAAIGASGFVELPVSAAHAAGVAQLERHHNDPFDRLLVAQALAEPLKLVTADGVLARYSDVVLLVGDIGPL